MKRVRIFLVFMLVMFLPMNFFSKSKKATKVPEIIEKSILMAKEGKMISSGIEVVFNDVYFFPTQGSTSEVVFSFKYGTINDKTEREESKKIKRDVAVIEIINKKKKKESIRLFYPLEGELYRTDGPLYFEFQAKPGEYTVIIAVASSDLKKVGTMRKDLKVFSMRTKKLDTSSIVFIKDLKQLDAVDTKFKIYKNSFPMGMYIAYPYIENSFRANENPQVLFFILGAKVHKMSRKFKISLGFSILNSEGKEIAKFKPQTIESTVVVQPIPLVIKGKPLSGNFTLKINIIDLSTRKSIKKMIDFSVK